MKVIIDNSIQTVALLADSVTLLGARKIRLHYTENSKYRLALEGISLIDISFHGFDDQLMIEIYSWQDVTIDIEG